MMNGYFQNDILNVSKAKIFLFRFKTEETETMVESYDQESQTDYPKISEGFGCTFSV